MLINCVAYQNGRKLADITVEEISDYVSRPDCFVWVALFEPDDAEIANMAEEFGLHELAVEDARKGHQRPKIEEYGPGLFAVLQTVDVDPAQPDGDFLLGEVHLFVGRNYILSVRRKTLHGFADVRARAEQEPENLAHGSGFVFYAIMDTVVDRYFPALDKLDSELEKLETQIFREAPSRSNIEAFYDLKYRLMVLKHAVAPLMEAVGKLFGGRVPPVCLGAQEYFRDVYDHLMRISAAIESQREMLQTGISVSLTLISLADSQVTKRLAAYGALITVPTLIAGIYGMNFDHMPELNWLLGYPLALAMMIVIDTVLFFRFRKAGWL
ncbi:MAG TPA: magnesium/cobalt transporter CorA [Casimicrobiaceae bacterium]|nr:magnesium/cobalt transporter CorA [Casimicrobiaceae bacterium]